MNRESNKHRRQIIRGIIPFILNLVLIPAALFVTAGSLDWPMAWVYIGLFLATNSVSYLMVIKKHPDLLCERAEYASVEGTQSWDRLLAAVVGLFGPLVMMITAGLDHRFGRSSNTPSWMQLAGAMALASGYGLSAWAFVKNRFFSAVARIQKDRGQVVVTSGPYRFVRHPAYAGAFLAALAFPFMLDSLWTLIPGLLLASALIIRTILEDRMLMDGLGGYPSYAEKTPYRLIPGIW